MVRRILFTALIFICASFTSCRFGWDEIFYRKYNVNMRASCLTELDADKQPATDSEDTYGVAVFSDIHIGSNAPKHMEDFLEWLETAKDDHKIKFCICLGDIADHGYEKEFADYNEFCEKISNILGEKNSVYSIVGNHDLYNSGWEHYKKMVFPNESFYHFKTKNFSWYAMDSASDTLGEIQMEALRTAFASDENPKIILGHVPVYGDPFFKLAYFSFQDEHESSMLLSLFANYNVKLAMAGHSHAYYEKDYPTFKEYVVSSMNYKYEWTLLEINEKEGTVKLKRIIDGKEQK